MDEPILTVEERNAINSGRWFSALSPSLKHDILRYAYVRRYRDGELLAARGEPPEEWVACAKGDNNTYTGTKVKGIGTMHKSNAVPIFSDEEAIDISKMRR